MALGSLLYVDGAVKYEIEDNYQSRGVWMVSVEDKKIRTTTDCCGRKIENRMKKFHK